MKKNINVSVTRKVIAILLAFAVATSVVVASPISSITAQAAVYTQGSQSLSITDGMAVLTAGGETLQLTTAHICNDGGMYVSTYPIALTLWKGNTLFGYCYDLQGKTCELILIDTGVTSLLFSGNGSSRVVTGYMTSEGVKSLPTLEQFKAKLGIGSNGSTSGSNTSGGNTSSGNTSGSNTNTSTIGKPIVSGNVVTYSDGNKFYTLSTGKYAISAANNYDGTSFIHFADGSLYFWSYSLQKQEPVVTLHKVADACNGLLLDSAGYAISYYDSKGTLKSLPTQAEIKAVLSATTGTYSSSLEGNNAYLSVLENGYYKKVLVASNSKIQLVGNDNIGSLYIYYGDTLEVWNYQLQKSTNKKPINVSQKCTGLAYIEPGSNKIAGYYENGSLKPLWTLNQIKDAINPSSSDSNYVKWYESKTTTNGHIKTISALASNGKTTSSVEWDIKNNTIIFNGEVVFKGGSDEILAVNYTNKSKHLILIRTASRKCYKLNRSNGKVKKFSDSVYSFKKVDESHFIKVLKLTDGSKIDVPNTF